MRRFLVLLALALGPAAPAYAVPDLPPANLDFDYQLGGSAEPADNVAIVVRDRLEEPADGLYNICYVNGFQTQPNERRFWRRHHWNLVLKDEGKPVVDSAWGEWLLDITTKRKRDALVKIVGRWTAKCADDGFDAVEYDNLDSFSRSHGLIAKRHTKAFAERLVRRAHRADLAVAQKNWAEFDGSVLGFDFAIAEECGRWRECDAYIESYGDHVLVVEYRSQDFDYACEHWGDQLAIVRRDLDLTPDGVHEWC